MPNFAPPNRSGRTHEIVGPPQTAHLARWRCEAVIEKYAAGADDVRRGTYGSSAGAYAGQPVVPYERQHVDGNMLLNSGADLLWIFAMGPGTTSVNQAKTYFNAHASIGVGNSTTAAARTQTDLQGASKFRKGMEASYPQHTTGTGSTNNRNITFRSLYSTAMANFAWKEWGVFNSTSLAQGRMMNRKVEDLGTKTTAATWTFTVTLSITT
jgi:hypothetical protein